MIVEPPHFQSIFGSTLGGVYNPKLIDDDRYLDFIEWFDNTNSTTVNDYKTKREVVRTFYDTPNSIVPLAVLTQSEETMRKRVASITYEDWFDRLTTSIPPGEPNDLSYEHATHYDYDIHGNVNSLVQDNKN